MTEHEQPQEAQEPQEAQQKHPRQVSRRAALTTISGVGLGIAGIAGAGRALAGESTPATTAGSAGGFGDGPAGGPRASTSPSCILVPEQTEGPYYLDYELVRRDITEGRSGLPFVLRATVVHATTCVPIPNAAVDIWHCDAVGVYSGYTSVGPGGGSGTPPTGAPTATPTDAPTATPTAAPTAPPSGGPGGPGGPGGHQEPTDDLTFLRGVQLTDRRGVAELRTIYPGWYQGRAIHIHVKVHIGGSVDGTTYTGGHVSHTGQFYFAEEVTEQVALLDPYATNTAHRTTLDEDGIYANGGSAGLLTLTPQHQGRDALRRGLLGTIVVGVDPDATPGSA